MKKILLFLCLFISFSIFSQNLIQWSDDFSDGDFTKNPTWSGMSENFIVNEDSQLQSNASTTSKSYLSTPSEAFEDAVWEFWVRINYTTSSSNYAMVYIIADRADISGDVNGYYVQIGNTADEISLYRQQGNSRTKIIDGVDKSVDTNPVIVNIRVTRSKDGTFSLFRKRQSDVVGFSDADFVQEGESVIDNEVQGSKYFGVLFSNSSTTGKAYLFDDIFVKGEKFADVIPPEWTDLQLVEPNQLVLTFSEAVDISSASFHVDNGIGNPVSSMLSEDGMTLRLTFAKGFEKGVIYTVEALNVKDLAGNPLTNTQKQIGKYEFLKAGDIVINEILFETANGVPEYFEIYNVSDKILLLDNSYFAVRSPSTGSFSLNNAFPANTILLAKSYLALSSDPDLVKEHFDVPSSANILKANRWSALNNTSARFLIAHLDIRTENGLTVRDTVILDELHYNVKWHSELSTANVALERINPKNRTQIPTNWYSAAPEVNFGTPGYENSRYMMPDTIPPVLTGLAIIEPNKIVLNFSEIIDISTATFSVDQGIGNSTGLTVLADEMTLIISFDNDFEKGKIYTINILNIKDLAGNPLVKNTYQTGILELAEKDDLVINEILFDNLENSAEYFEIYNKSGKVIDLTPLFFTVNNSTYNYFPSQTFILPGEYLAFSPEPELVKEAYTVPEIANIRKSERWSALNNTEASFLIGYIVQDSVIALDSVRYNAKWHHTMIKNPKGVSLERINPNFPSQSPSSWHSAASEVGYGTPGYKNSQYRDLETTVEPEKWIWVEPEAFSPDNDGIDDVCFIRYKTDAAGYTANIIIFNSVGVKVKQLGSNILLSQDGILTWDGKTDRGQNVNQGIYVLYVEFVNSDKGVKKIEKIPLVVSAR